MTYQKKEPLNLGDFGKFPPQAREMEGAILGAIMLDKYAYDTANEILTADCFYSEANQRIYKAMQSLALKNMPIDMLTVVQELQKLESLDLVGGPYYVSKLTNAVVSSANLETHARIVLQKHISRELIRIAGELIGDAYNDVIDVFELRDQAEEKIMNLSSKYINGDMVSIDKVLDQAVNKIEQWRKNGDTVTGVESGFTELDISTRGWQPGDLIVLGARPSIGKTAIALNLVRNAAMGNKPCTVAVWSLEMKAVYLVLRMLAAESDIYLHRLQTGQMEDWQMDKLIKEGVNKLKQANIFFDENSSVTLATVRAKARKLKKKNGLGLIVIDYLQLMSGEGKSGNREQEVSKISRGLKNLAQELEVPIIALSQLSRASSESITWEHGPGISSLRESGGIEQDADLILLLWGPTDDEVVKVPALQGRRKIKVAKQRNGMLATIELNFRNEIQLFQAIDHQVNGNFKPVQLPQPVIVNNFPEELPF
jgi:replicative DNA helicase